MQLLAPSEIVASLQAIKLKTLRQRGKRGIILDLDNTITPWDKDELTAEAQMFLQEAKTLDFRICLLTNATKDRASRLALDHQLLYVAPAFKPRKKAFLKALGLLELSAAETVVIGDQIFTDVLGGNRVGCYTILVPPLSKKEFIMTKIMRSLEKGFRR